MNTLHTHLSKLNIFESWLIGISLAFCLLGFTGLFFFFQEYQEKMYPGVFVAHSDTKKTISLAGLTKLQAQEVIEKSFVLTTDTAISFTTQMNSVQVSPIQVNSAQANASHSASLSQIGLRYETQKTVEDAFKIGRSGNIITQIFSVLNLQFRPNYLEVEMTIQPDKFSEALGEPLQKKLYIEPATPSAKLTKSGDEDTLTIDPGKKGQFFDENVAKEIVRKTISLDENIETISVSHATFESGYVLSDEEVRAARARAARIISKSLQLTGTVPRDTTDAARDTNTDMATVKTTTDATTSKNQTIIRKLLDTDIIPLLSFKDLTNANSSSNLLKDDKVADLLEKWQTELSTPVQEPELEIDTTSKKVLKFIPPINGIELDSDQAKQNLQDSIAILASSNEENQDIQSNHLSTTLPLQVVFPKKTLGDLNTLGIAQVIGHGDSEYTGSIPNRAFNVNLTANKITNTLVASGEEFSFNKTLGEVSARTGFRSAYVIKNGRTELGDGGGVCQVSTTVFRAALDAGLAITRRLQHSYRVGYYEQNSLPGLDATVYAGNVDLRFKNDTTHHILIHNVVNQDDMSMTTQIFGTSDGRKSELISHEVWGAVSAPAPQFFTDPTIAPGKRIQIDWAVGGVKTRAVNKITYSDGTIKETEYYSNYRPWSAKYLVGI